MRSFWILITLWDVDHPRPTWHFVLAEDIGWLPDLTGPRYGGSPARAQLADELRERGYQDSRWVLDAAGDVPRTRETAAGMALVDAQLLAAMRRTIANHHVRFDLRPPRALTRPQIEALDQAARRYGEYLRLKTRLTLPLPSRSIPSSGICAAARPAGVCGLSRSGQGRSSIGWRRVTGTGPD